MIKDKTSDKPYIPSWLWKAGIALWILGVALVNVYIHFNPEADQLQVTSDLIYSLGLSGFVVLILTLLIAPVLEELAFRFWTKGRLFSKIVSHGLIVMFLTLSGINIFVVAAVSILLFVIFYIIKPAYRYSNVINAAVTSIIFGAIHKANFTEYWVQAAAVVQTMGAGFILSYIGLRYRFIFCIIFHLLYNTLAVSVAEYRINSEKALVLNGITYTAELKAKGLLDNNASQIIKLGQDTVSITGTLHSIACDIAISMQNQQTFLDTVYFESKQGSVRYKLSASAKKDTIISYEELFKDLSINTEIKSDTVIQNAYVLKHTDDQNAHQSSASPKNANSVYTLVSVLRDNLDIPIVTEAEQLIVIELNDFSFIHIKTLEQMRAYLLDKYNLDIVEDDSRKVMCITFH